MPISLASTVKLNTGAEIPVVGLGTWKSAPGRVEEAVEYALKKAGYRHIDTATDYGNEKEVGEGIKASGVPRESIFVTTKLKNDDHDKVEQALEYSLKQLDTPYIDLWLLHWPAPMLSPTGDGKPNRDLDWLDTWKELERVHLANKNKVRAIGVSNLSVPFLKRLLKEAKVIPAVNQIELHPSLPQKEVVKVTEEAGILLTSYSPLGSDESPLLTDEVIVKIAKKYNVEPAAILVSFQVAHPNRTVLPKSVTPSRISANAQIVELTPEEFAEIDKIGESKIFRVCNPTWAGWGDLGFDLSKEKESE
ncbi:Aldo/keto reductase [Cantharellus anzutake]|uniref:Aldo/keto reductase n=1 Tax=Cantharellus anzutake TaxID=1750568 RepID=UPI0019041755|nr:Aldo/keto reductase [Cantharellus anzutake]KAF8342564.1 Aldo/keto reductase [Cantharellus anzutake]